MLFSLAFGEGEDKYWLGSCVPAKMFQVENVMRGRRKSLKIRGKLAEEFTG
jgi:hypothetical protein